MQIRLAVRTSPTVVHNAAYQKRFWDAVAGDWWPAQHVLEQIKLLVNRILSTAQKQHSFLALGETMLTSARLALLEWDLKKVDQLFSQAESLGHEEGMGWLVSRVSRERDKMLVEMDRWESLRELQAPLVERAKMAGLQDYVRHALRVGVLQNE